MSRIIDYIAMALLVPVIAWVIWICFQIDNWVHTSSTIDWWPL